MVTTINWFNERSGTSLNSIRASATTMLSQLNVFLKNFVWNVGKLNGCFGDDCSFVEFWIDQSEAAQAFVGVSAKQFQNSQRVRIVFWFAENLILEFNDRVASNHNVIGVLKIRVNFLKKPSHTFSRVKRSATMRAFPLEHSPTNSLTLTKKCKNIYKLIWFTFDIVHLFIIAANFHNWLNSLKLSRFFIFFN